MSTENKETIIIDGTSINEDINSVVSVEEKHNLDDEDNEFQDEDNEFLKVIKINQLPP